MEVNKVELLTPADFRWNNKSWTTNAINKAKNLNKPVYVLLANDSLRVYEPLANKIKQTTYFKNKYTLK